MSKQQNLNELTGIILNRVTAVLEDYLPDYVLVHGDTTTTLASALACYYKKIPVGHVEAGLRTGNIYSPWPEEINRKLVGSVAKHHYSPTELAARNLEFEGIQSEFISITGNTVIDALLHVSQALQDNKLITDELDNEFCLNQKKNIILVTCHRRESFGKNFSSVCNSLIKLADREDVYIIFPVHPNPNIKIPVEERLGDKKNIRLIEPQGYLQFVHLMNRSKLILTDSGGVQEEAPSLGKPVLLLRATTERPEGVDAGTVKIVGTDSETIISETSNLLDNNDNYMQMANRRNPYGDGLASRRIRKVIEEYFEQVN